MFVNNLFTNNNYQYVSLAQQSGQSVKPTVDLNPRDSESRETCSITFWSLSVFDLVEPVVTTGVTELQDGNLTWNSSWPRFTDCFQKVALTGGPCALLLVMSLLYGYYLLTLKDDVLPTRRLTYLKTMCCTCLGLVSVCELALPSLQRGTLTLMDITQFRLTSHTFAPLMMLMIVVLSTTLIRLENQKGQRSSIVLFLFWLILTFCQTVPVYSIVLDQVYVEQPVNSILMSGKFALLLCLLVLHCLTDYPAPVPTSDDMALYPDPYEPLWSRMTFAWVKEFLTKGKDGTLAENDIYQLLPSQRSCTLMDRFAPYWQWEVDKAKHKNEASRSKEEAEDPEKLLERLLNEGKNSRKRIKLHRTKSVETPRKRGIVYNRSQSEFRSYRDSDSLLDTEEPVEKEVVVDEQEKTDETSTEEGKKEFTATATPKARPSFLLAMIRCFGMDFAIKQFLCLLRVLMEMVDPVMFGVFLAFMEDQSAPMWWGYMICGLMVLNKIIRIVLWTRTDLANQAFAQRIKSAIANSIFQKTLTMDTESRQESTVGQAVNLLSVDIGDIGHALNWMASEVMCVPVKIIIALVMLYNVFGSSMLVSVAILALMVPINSVLSRKISVCHEKIMELKDERLKIFTEVINGVKILKMYAWEPSFIEKVTEARDKELNEIWWRVVYDTGMHLHWAVSPYVVSLTMFLMYVHSSENHYLSPSVAFMALSLIRILKNNMGTVPHVITHFVKVFVSFNRLNEFLGRTDLDNDVTSDKEEVISVSGGFFSWTSGAAPTLKNINMNVKKGSLVAVVGTVGCGKSSLISACLGEMKKLKGHVSVKGSVAYVPQQAWIQHATLKDNVLFGKELDEDLYQQCLDDCALRSDLDILPGGDMTEIGEKGINLSGGQKQRVSLARAVYSQADVYLFDDPLSAVDCHVGGHIFDKVIGHQGQLAGKTRVLVTHGVQWLPKVDQIIVIRHGRVSEIGSYDELLAHNGPFAKFLKSYLAHNADSDSDPMMEKVKAELLHRLESIPSSVKSSTSVTEGNNDGFVVVSSCESSSSDNESIIQEMMKSMGLEHAKQQEQTVEENDMLTEDLVKEEKPEEEQEKEKNSDNKTNGTLVEDEEYKVQEVSWETMKEFSQIIGFTSVAVLLGLFAMQHFAERLGDLSLSRWTDDPMLSNLTALPMDSEERVALNNHYLMVYAGFGLVYAICILIFEIVKLFRRIAIARILHHRMLSCVLHAPMTFFDTTPVGRIVNRFSSDLATMDSNLINTMDVVFDLLFGVVGKFCVICYVTPIFMITILPLAFIFNYVKKYFAPTMRVLERLASKARAPIFSYFSETLGGTAVIRAFGAQQRFLREFQHRNDKLKSVEFSWVNCNKWLHVRMEGISLTVLVTVVLTAVPYKDVLSAGVVGLAFTQAMDIAGCLHRLVHMVAWLQTQLVSVDRVKQYCTLKQEADWRIEDTKPTSSWPEKGQVKAVDIALRYREGLDLVLKGINVNIGAGEKVGIVGRTGAGKSSLTLALFRLVEPARGGFQIDDVSINDLGLHDLRARLTILPQDPVIFAGSLRMNLDPFSHYTDEEVWEALKHAHLSDFVSGLKEGLKHECGEGGENLSVGQRQLLCLARTLLHKTRVLVLDEATAAVDMETDDLIQNTIRSEFSDCTVLTIAHRLNTVIDYDKILVLDKGQVVEFDSPGNLMDNPSSIFHDMCKKAGLLHKRRS